MQTLSYGYKKPETNDKGSVVFPALEALIQQLNDHAHNGINSAKVSSSNLTKTTQTISSSNWTLVSGGHYTQTLTLPGALVFDDLIFTFKLDSGAPVFPTVTKISTSQYAVAFDDNTLNLTAVFS